MAKQSQCDITRAGDLGGNWPKSFENCLREEAWFWCCSNSSSV